MEYSNKGFKTLLKQAEAKGFSTKFLAEAPYRKAVPILKAAPEGLSAPGEREAWFAMTDSGVDREGDVIMSPGMDVEQFSSYGSILWGHRADKPEFVLGHPAEVVKQETRILVRASFLDAEANPTADRVLRMIKAGGVRAMSVGLMIREYSEANDRAGWMPLNILQSELIETSVTPVPVNPRAVLLAAGGSQEEAKALGSLFEEAADHSLTEARVKDLIQETLDQLLGSRTYSIPSGSSTTASAALNNLARLIAQ